MSDRIAVLGAGAWGTALAVILARNGHRTILAARRRESRDQLARSRANAAYLPNVAIPDTVELTDSWSEAVADASMVVMAVPSRYARASMLQIAHDFRRESILVSATKGIEEDSLATMTAMLAEVTPHARAFAALSGPGFA